jgi:hypothetical protein
VIGSSAGWAAYTRTKERVVEVRAFEYPRGAFSLEVVDPAEYWAPPDFRRSGESH